MGPRQSVCISSCEQSKRNAPSERLSRRNGKLTIFLGLVACELLLLAKMGLFVLEKCFYCVSVLGINTWVSKSIRIPSFPLSMCRESPGSVNFSNEECGGVFPVGRSSAGCRPFPLAGWIARHRELPCLLAHLTAGFPFPLAC